MIRARRATPSRAIYSRPGRRRPRRGISAHRRLCAPGWPPALPAPGGPPLASTGSRAAGRGRPPRRYARPGPPGRRKRCVRAFLARFGAVSALVVLSSAGPSQHPLFAQWVGSHARGKIISQVLPVSDPRLIPLSRTGPVRARRHGRELYRCDSACLELSHVVSLFRCIGFHGPCAR